MKAIAWVLILIIKLLFFRFEGENIFSNVNNYGNIFLR